MDIAAEMHNNKNDKNYWRNKIHKLKQANILK